MKYIICIATLIVASSASACSFGPDADLFKTAKQNYENQEYPYVLSGTITGKTQTEQMGQQYEFTIGSVHKGQVSDNVIVLNSPGHSCGFFSSEGVHMLVFLRQLGEIDESNPRYIFESVGLAVKEGVGLEPQLPAEPLPGVCTKEYMPVCAKYQVQCIQAPCPPVDTTYANSCLAKQAGAVFAYAGECKAVITVPETEAPTEPSRIKNLPTANPEDRFLEPTTPPPYDNSVKNTEVETKKSWWQNFKSWITRMLSF